MVSGLKAARRAAPGCALQRRVSRARIRVTSWVAEETPPGAGVQWGSPRGWVPPEGQEGPHPGVQVVGDDLGDLGDGVAHAGQVGDRLHRCVTYQTVHDAARTAAVLAGGAVGHRDEVGRAPIRASTVAQKRGARWGRRGGITSRECDGTTVVGTVGVAHRRPARVREGHGRRARRTRGAACGDVQVVMGHPMVRAADTVGGSRQ